LDPDNNIKESNEANNKKIFTIECSDANGNVPKDDAKEEEKKEETGNDTGSGTGKPDLVVTLDPTKMDNGRNTIKLSIKNNSNVTITKPFAVLVEIVDATGKTIDPTKYPAKGEIKGLEANKDYAVNDLFPGGFPCDVNNPQKVMITVDSTKIIDEKLENNNYAESICGAIKSGTGGGNEDNSGGGADPKKDKPCSAGNALIEISNLNVSEVLDGAGKALTGNY